MKTNNRHFTKKRFFLGLLMAVFALMQNTVFAQDGLKTIQGVVTSSEDGLPLPGVNVIKVGTNAGTITDFDGIYTIKAKIGDVLKFNFIGMKDKTITVQSTTLNVILDANAEALDEVVVVGYGKLEKKEVTGAVTRVKAAELENIISNDVASALQGKVAGVNIVSSAEPGQNSEILIRGVTSLTGSNEPLWVVDGVPQQGNPGLAQNEIETIDVLKDAASAAIYGTRGAAGVILVTTKQGENGRLKVTANLSRSIQDVTSGLNVANAAELNYIDLLERRRQNDPDDLGTLPGLLGSAGYQNDTRLIDSVIRDGAPVTDFSLNITGGAEEFSYNVSTGLYKREGVVIGSELDRFNTRINTTYNKNRIKAQVGLGLVYQQLNRPQGFVVRSAYTYRPTLPDYNPNIDDVVFAREGQELSAALGISNALDNTDTDENVRTFGNVNLSYKVTDDLDVTARTSINLWNSYRKRFNPFREVFVIDFFGVPEEESRTLPESSSSIENNAIRNRNLVAEAYATYNKTLNDVHSFTLTAGLSKEIFVTERFRASRNSLPAGDDLSVLDVATGDRISATSGGLDATRVTQGFFGRLLYNYDDRYVFSGSLRRDASSKFSKENRWGTFPSVSAAWNVSEESFWGDLKETINNFRFRASLGTVGNERIPDYVFSTNIVSNVDIADFDDASDGSVIGLGKAQTGFGNSQIKWETTRQLNLGVDMAFLNNKINLVAEYYKSDVSDMLFPTRLPGSTSGLGNAVVQRNVGDMTNEGFELSLAYKENKGAFKWNTNVTFSTNKNEITKLTEGVDLQVTGDNNLVPGGNGHTISYFAKGYQAGAFFTRKTDGLVNTDEKLIAYRKLNPEAELGDVIYKDINNDGEITDEDIAFSGSGLSDYEIGWNFDASYKGFDFAMQWHGAFGQEIANGTKASLFQPGNLRHVDLINAWTPQNRLTNLPRLDNNTGSNYADFSDVWIEDGSYVRLRNIAVGYKLPKKTVEKLGMSRLRFYLSAQNVLTFTKYSGFNPEIGGPITTRGLDRGAYPVSRLFTAGLQITF